MQDDFSYVEKQIQETILQVCGKKIEDVNSYLLSAKNKIILVDWLYVLEKLEESYHYPVFRILEKNDYTIFTIHNLAQGICNEIKNDS